MRRAVLTAVAVVYLGLAWLSWRYGCAADAMVAPKAEPRLLPLCWCDRSDPSVCWCRRGAGEPWVESPDAAATIRRRRR